MSSNRYSAELHPDAVLRRVVLLSGVGLCFAGVAIILALPLHTVLSIGCSGAWLALCAGELVNIRRGYALCCSLRVTPGGGVLLLDSLGNWQTARLLSGSVLLRRIGWFRLETGSGRRCAELLRGSCRKSDDWRRLQVIWRHVGAVQ